MAPVTTATTPSTIHETRHAYLKWPRLIAFGLTGALAVTATGLNAEAINRLEHDKKTLKGLLPNATLNATDVLTAAGLMTTAAGLAALYCTALSVMILFRLHKEETKRSILVKEICMVLLALILLGSCIAASVIILNRSASITASGIPAALITGLLRQQGRSLAYKDSIVYKGLIVCWICFAFVVISFVLAALTSRHIKKYGSESTLLGGGNGHHHSHKEGAASYEAKAINGNGNGHGHTTAV